MFINPSVLKQPAVLPNTVLCRVSHDTRVVHCHCQKNKTIVFRSKNYFLNAISYSHEHTCSSTFANFLRFVLMTFLVIHAQKLAVAGVKRRDCVRVCATKRANTIWLCAHRARTLQCNPHTHSWCSTASKYVQTTSETHPEEKWSQLMRKYNQKGLRIARLRGLESVARSREEDFFLFSSRAKCPGMKWFRNNVVKRQSRQWNALSQQTTQPVHLWKQSCAKQLLYSFF